MVEPIPLLRPIRWDALRSDEAQRLINDWSQDTASVVITSHATERTDLRMSELIDTEMIYALLQRGTVANPPLKNEHGHWQAEVEKRMPGGREVTSVTVILKEEHKLIVRTVMWRDER